VKAHISNIEPCSGFGPGGRATSRRAPAGFTFIEVLLATLVLGTMLVTATTALSTAVVAQNTLVSQPVTAYGLAREIHSLALLLPRTEGDGVPAATGAQVQLLEDLDGASFTPAIGADAGAAVGGLGWSQDVELEIVDLASPTLLAADASSDSTLLRLTVTVREGAEERGTYVWWLNP
jgi:hypothetical protein